MKKEMTRVHIGNVVCAALMLVLLVMQFTPYWHYGDAGEQAASISQYVWFPNDFKDLDSHIAQQVEGYAINQMVLTPILVLVLTAVGVVLGLAKPGCKATALLPVACGVVGTVGYLTSPALKLGALWGIHLALLVLLAAAGAVTLLWGLKKN